MLPMSSGRCEAFLRAGCYAPAAALPATAAECRPLLYAQRPLTPPSAGTPLRVSRGRLPSRCCSPCRARSERASEPRPERSSRALEPSAQPRARAERASPAREPSARAERASRAGRSREPIARAGRASWARVPGGRPEHLARSGSSRAPSRQPRARAERADRARRPSARAERAGAACVRLRVSCVRGDVSTFVCSSSCIMSTDFLTQLHACILLPIPIMLEGSRADCVAIARPSAPGPLCVVLSHLLHSVFSVFTPARPGCFPRLCCDCA